MVYLWVSFFGLTVPLFCSGNGHIKRTLLGATGPRHRSPTIGERPDTSVIVTIRTTTSRSHVAIRRLTKPIIRT